MAVFSTFTTYTAFHGWNSNWEFVRYIYTSHTYYTLYDILIFLLHTIFLRYAVYVYRPSYSQFSNLKWDNVCVHTVVDIYTYICFNLNTLWICLNITIFHDTCLGPNDIFCELNLLNAIFGESESVWIPVNSFPNLSFNCLKKFKTYSPEN